MNLGLYIHIPFCSRRCDYCDFATWTDREESVETYVSTLLTQWKLFVDGGNLDSYDNITTIFFGGGTPNLIAADHIAGIITTVSSDLTLAPDCEITVESNPDHVAAEKCTIYMHAGVNRISLGVQSTQAHVLSFLGREHNPDHVHQAMDTIRQSGISNINCDLIYGSAVETREDWDRTLKDVVSMEPQHISAYALGIEPGTPLGIDVARSIKEATNEDDLADKYLHADSVLTDHGYEWYEISNWSQPGSESRHNQTYWLGGDVLGLGCAAHSHVNSKRFATPRNIDVYIEKMSSARTLDEIVLERSAGESISRAEETFALALRTRSGCEIPDPHAQMVADLVSEGLVARQGPNAIALTPRGRLVAHEVAVALFDQFTTQDSAVQ